MDPAFLLETARAQAAGHRPVAVLWTARRAAHARSEGFEHVMVLVEEADAIRLLSWPKHPRTGRRLDVSLVPVALARHVVAFGHQNEPMRYRFLDHLRSSEVLDDPDGAGAKLVAAAGERVRTRRLQGDYVHTMSANVEDMWGQHARGDWRGAWTVAREVANGALAMLLDEDRGVVETRDREAEAARLLDPGALARFRLLQAVPEDAPALVARCAAAVEARGNVPAPPEAPMGEVERALLAEVKVLADDLVRRHGDRIRAVGATGSIGRHSATADADYDVHVLVAPQDEDEAHRIDFHLYVPTYPGLPRRAELGFTPTTFVENLLRDGVTTPFSYYHLDHVRHTALVHDPWGEGKRFQEACWNVRPPEGFVEGALGRIRAVLDRLPEMPAGQTPAVAEALGDECARLLLMRHGLGFVKLKYRSLNLDKIRAAEPEFFAAYDRLKGLAGLGEAESRAACVAATALFDAALEKLEIDYRYRCAEMETS